MTSPGDVTLPPIKELFDLFLEDSLYERRFEHAGWSCAADGFAMLAVNESLGLTDARPRGCERLIEDAIAASNGVAANREKLRAFAASLWRDETCEKCGGAGESKCQRCGGTGHVTAWVACHSCDEGHDCEYAECPADCYDGTISCECVKGPGRKHPVRVLGHSFDAQLLERALRHLPCDTLGLSTISAGKDATALLGKAPGWMVFVMELRGYEDAPVWAP